jgi:Fe-S-cluster formation regulator IscX/YfhJ
MDYKRLIEELYNGYYSIDNNTFDFHQDTDYIHALHKIQDIEGKSSKEIDELIRKRFYDSISSSDPNIASKLTLHIQLPMFISLERTTVLFETINNFHNIDLGFNYLDFVIICHSIIFRVQLHILFKKYFEGEEYFNSLLNEKFPNINIDHWFDVDELYEFNKLVDKEKIRKFLDIFSISPDVDSNYVDTFRILNIENKYTVIFLSDFTYYSYFYLENHILRSFNYDNSLISEYGKVRGEKFELFIYRMFNDFYQSEMIHKNIFYRDINGNKSELDLVVELKNVILNIELKSSRFDIAFLKNSKELDTRFISAFKRSYKSIDRFHRTEDGVDKVINLNNKSIISLHVTAYDIKYIASEIQRDIIPNLPKYDYYPINVNCIDLKSILLTLHANEKGYENFESYLVERFKLINNHKNIKFDLDEIDMFGFLTTDSEENRKSINILKSSPTSVPVDFLISNGIYREQINKALDNLFTLWRFKTFFDEEACDFLEKVFIRENSEE